MVMVNDAAPPDNSSPNERFNERFAADLRVEIANIRNEATDVDAKVRGLREEIGVVVYDVGHPTIAQFIQAHRHNLAVRIDGLYSRLSAYGQFEFQLQRDLRHELEELRLYVDLIGLHQLGK